MTYRKKIPSATFISDIEVLRAVAIIYVLFAHSFFLFPWSNFYYNTAAQYVVGWPGVDLFFCVSGFVITRELLPASEASSARGELLGWAAPFWIKRAWRILPSAWFWATFSLLASAFLPSLPGAGNFGGVFREWVASLVQSVNVYYLSCNPNCGGGSVFTTVYWSLALEDQFYIVLPFVLFIIPRVWLAPSLLVLILSQFFLYRPQAPLNALWYLRTDAISIGVLIALGHGAGALNTIEPTCLRIWRYRWPIVGGLVFLLGTLPSTGISISTGMVALVSGALVLVASFNKDYVMRHGRLKRALMWVGARSFALYLAHLPAFAFTRLLIDRWRNTDRPYADHHTAVFVLVAAAMLVVLAELNFRLIERPLRRHGRKLADQVARRSESGGTLVDVAEERSPSALLKTAVR